VSNSIETEIQTAGRVLLVGGSDCSGGAGIQADIKAVCAMGGHAATAITAITVQNTLGVSAVQPLDDEIILAQMRAVLDDIGTDTIKTGMLGSASLIQKLAALLKDQAAETPLIIDPVMVATSGDALISDDAARAIREMLVPMATLITPNIPEAEALTGGKVTDLGSQIAAGEELMEMGAQAALIKGGHLDGNVMRDVLVSSRGMNIMERPRIDTPHTHGTGCTLASAIAALLAQGVALPDAVQSAGDYLHEAIANAPGFGAGHGPVDHMWLIRG
jgi:hydroxymethylpyrimidine/phosphomethylpyrimidine kinase